MDIRVEGIVIRERNVSDSAKLLTVLTGALGKIVVLAKGIKSITSKNSHAVQLFCYSTFELVEHQGGYILKTALLTENFYGLRNDCGGYYLASYMLDVVGSVTAEGNDETEVLRLLLNTLYAIVNRQSLELWHIKASFELKFAEICGFCPELCCCGYCGREIDGGKDVLFSPQDAFVVCDDCEKSVRENGGTIQYSKCLSSSVLAAMKYIVSTNSQRYLLFKLDSAYSAEFSFICESYLLNRLERSFNTLKIYKSMLSTMGEK